MASVAVAAVACAKTKSSTTAMSDDLKRDLRLATTQPPVIQVNADELGPQSHKEVALKLKKAPGPKVMRSSHPTVKASQTPREVAEVKADMPAVQVTASAPAESQNPSPDAPPSARPAPIPVPSTSGSAPGSGSGSGASQGTGIGSVLGGILGGILGGVVVGDDHCDPRTDGRRRGRGGVYGPRGGGGVIIIPGGGYPRGSGRFPIIPRGR